MTWDWKKTLEDGDASPAAPAAKAPPRPTKRPRARGARQADASPETRHDAGIVLVSTRAHTAGQPADPPELLYGKEYECAFCRGRGQWPNSSICPVCHGAGKVRVPAPAVRCVSCRGKGRKTASSSVTCVVCGGRGVVAVTPPVQVCPECNGRGKKRGQSLYCTRCRGSGVVTSRRQRTDTGSVSTDIGTGPELGRKAS